MLEDKCKTKEQLIFLVGLIVAAALMVSAMLAAVPTLADQEPKQVLILNSHDYGMPWQRIVNQAIYAAFEADTSIETELHAEYTGLSQNFDDAYVRKLLDLYGHKYIGQEMDIIIAVDIAATDFLIEHGEGLFPGAPIVFISDTEDIESMGLRPNMTGLLSEIDVRGTLDAALELHPDTQRIAVVSGASEMDRLYEAEARQVFQDYENRFEFIDLTGRPIDELLAEAAQLPEHAIVFYVLTLVDGAGEAFIPKEILTQISQASNAPLYGLWDSLLGSGIVGGHLSSAEVEGSKAAEMGLRILGGERPEDIPITQGAHAYMFDWRQLQRWGIRESDLPTGSVVRYKELSFWDQYKWRIIGVAALLVFEALLIFVLLIQQSRLRRTEVPLRRSRDQLELRVEERTAKLAQANQELQTEIAERRRMEQEIESILDHLPAPVFYKDKENNFIRVNKYVADAYEMTKTELEGKNLFDIYPKDTAQAYWDDDLEVINSGKPKLNIEEPWETQAGTKWVITSKIPFVDKNGDVKGVIGISIDITARKQAAEALRESKERLGLALEGTGVGLWDWMVQTGETVFNRRWAEIVGHTLEELAPVSIDTWIKLTHPDDLEKSNRLLEKHFAGETDQYICEARMKHKDGHWVWVLDQGKVFEWDEDGKPVRVAGTHLDITERKQAEEELKQYRERLEELVEERTARLEKANQELADFAYVVSHDLKAPLRAITQLAGWISEDYADAFDTDGQDMVQLLTGRTRRMHSLIQGLLEYSRIGRVKEREKEVDLNRLVQDTIEMLAPPANIQITIEDELPAVVGERTRFRQVFQNLLDNAIKFMDQPQGRVSVGCVDEGAHWLFSVADNGPGIEEKYYDKVFQMFQTLAPRDKAAGATEFESTGAGLPLVKKIVEGWGGGVWVESTVGEGSTFYFTLPKK